MVSPLIRKLSTLIALEKDDLTLLEQLTEGQVQNHTARRDVVHEGALIDNVHVILSGWACRYKLLEDGRRQILSFLLPGDVCGLELLCFRRWDHSVGAITSVRTASIPSATIHDLVRDRPGVARAFWAETLAGAAIQREWTMGLGQRSALERIGHLLHELFLRLHAVGLAKEEGFPLPLTQTDIADATGLTSVHVNRMLQELRARNLITMAGKTLIIHDAALLRSISMFRANYLHFRNEAEGADARLS